MPTKSAPTNAPRTEPMPPITITTKVKISILSPIPASTARIGPAITPAKPASRVPSPKTKVYKSRILMPKAPAISLLLAPARICMPIRVRVNIR